MRARTRVGTRVSSGALLIARACRGVLPKDIVAHVSEYHAFSVYVQASFVTLMAEAVSGPMPHGPVTWCSERIERVRGVHFPDIAAWVERSGGRVLAASDAKLMGVVGPTVAEYPAVAEWVALACWKNATLVISAGSCNVRRRFLRGRRRVVDRPKASLARISFEGVALAKEATALLTGAKKLLAKHQVKPLVKKTVRRMVHLLTSSKQGVRLKPTASIEGPLERGNYEAQVVADFDHVVADLSAPDPCGRLTLIHGPPGVGKTFLVRGIIEAAKGVRFVLIPSQMVSHLTVPGLAEMLMRQQIPTCLVIEDADMLLVPRMGDNMTSVGSLLNLADGIFGALADVRVICTTNADRMEFDAALLRSGRLCRNIEVSALGAERAAAVYRRLTGHEPGSRFGRDATLADAYQAARPDTRVGTKTGKKPGIGFEVK